MRTIIESANVEKRMRTILLSVKPSVFERIRNGSKKIEYRSNFPEGDVCAFFYVSSPVQAITGFAIFDNRVSIDDLKAKYSYDMCTIEHLNKMQIKNRFAIPIKAFYRRNRREDKREAAGTSRRSRQFPR